MITTSEYINEHLYSNIPIGSIQIDFEVPEYIWEFIMINGDKEKIIATYLQHIHNENYEIANKLKQILTNRNIEINLF